MNCNRSPWSNVVGSVPGCVYVKSIVTTFEDTTQDDKSNSHVVYWVIAGTKHVAGAKSVDDANSLVNANSTLNVIAGVVSMVIEAYKSM